MLHRKLIRQSIDFGRSKMPVVVCIFGPNVEGISSGYRNPELSSSRTSEQTVLVCWRPKGFNEMKLGLIQRQPGRRVPKDTHMGVTRFSGVHWNQWILNLTARYIRIASTFYETHVEIYYFHTEAHQGANFVAISGFRFCQKVSHFLMFLFQF